MELTIDFETRSLVDLKVHGVFRYAEHPLTEIMCLALMQDDDDPVYWMPEKFLNAVNLHNIQHEYISEQKIFSILKKADIVIAHNASFEYVIWNNLAVPRLNWPELQLGIIHDTMAVLAYHALPLNLDMASRVLELTSQKDMSGHALMLKMCKPRTPRKAERAANLDWMGDVYWHEEPRDLEKLVKYCCQDVQAERAVFNILARLPEHERNVWLMNERLNLRGVPIDVDNVVAVMDTLSAYEKKCLEDFKIATAGKVATPRSYAALARWAKKQTGLDIRSVDKEATEKILAIPDLPANVRTALNVKSELSKSSVAKLKAMLDRMSEDNRVRGWSIYHAASTGRFASWGLQLHNNPRDSYDALDYDSTMQFFNNRDVEALKIFWDNPYYCASRCIRGAIAAPKGKEFICTDFSAIEGRGLAYLAGEQWVLDAYAKGDDLYKHAAAVTFGISYDEVDKKQRQIGKVQELALGYAGGIGAAAALAKAYNVDLEQLPDLILPHATRIELDGPYGAKTLAKLYLKINPGVMSLEAAISFDVIKRKWRAVRPQIVNFWKSIEDCAVSALKAPGTIFRYRQIQFVANDTFLRCQLPSRRVLHYYKPRLRVEETDWGENPVITFMGMKIVEGKTTRQWARLTTFGGKLVENITQAFCRDLLVDAMLRHEQAGYKLIMDVHDEDMAEIDEGTGNLQEFNRIAEIVPWYAEGMPIKAEGWIGKRYQKG